MSVQLALACDTFAKVLKGVLEQFAGDAPCNEVFACSSSVNLLNNKGSCAPADWHLAGAGELQAD